MKATLFKINKILIFILLGVATFYGFSTSVLAQGPRPDTRSEQEILIAQLGGRVTEMEKLPSRIDNDDSLWTRITGGIFNTTNNELDERFYHLDRRLEELEQEVGQTDWTPEQRETINSLLARADRATKDYLLARQEAINNGIRFQSDVGTTEENRYAMNRFQELIRTNPEERDIAIPADWEGTDEEYFEHIAGRQDVAREANEGIVNEIKEGENQCFYWFGINPMACLLQGAAATATIILKLFGTLLWVSSSLFDLSVYISIISFKSLLSFQGIDAAWKIMRDLANLSFIFILLYIAISVIFDISVGSNGKKLIVDVIIIALLVNFSGFLVRVVVDASNVVAYEFYSRMSYDPQASESLVLGKINANIGTALVSKLSLMSHVVPNEESSDPSAVKITRLGFLQIIIGAIGGVIIILMASFVLLVAAIMFFIRTVTLLFVYVFSPIGLTLRLIPMFKDAHGKWRDALLKQSFYAPAFLIPLFAVFKILGDKGLSTLAQDAGIGAGLMKISAIQIIIMAMIASCIFIAQKFGAFGTGFATKWAGKGVNLLSKPAVGTTKLLGRGTLDVGRRAGRAISSSAAGQSISRGVGLLSSQVAGTRAVQGATSAARWAAGTAAGQAIRSSVASGARNVAKDFKSAVKDKVEHPLLYASDVISAGASKIGGVDGFNIMGATREERNKAKEEGKKKKEEERNSETNRLLRESLTSAASFADVQSIVSGIARDDLKIIDLKVFADIPQAACALSHDQIIRLTNREGKGGDDSKHKSKIRNNILTGGTTPFTFNADPAVYGYMNTGAGRVFWR